MYHIDLHVHTRRYSACAELLDPCLLLERMRLRGLHGVVITEHDRMWSAPEIAELGSVENDFHIYRGVEISSESGHFVVIGMKDLEGAEAGVSLHRLLRKAEQECAAVILAHPHLCYGNVKKPISPMEMPPGIHAVEVASTITVGKNKVDAYRLARLKGWAAVAGSDAHAIEHLGSAFTVFEDLPASEHELALAIRNGWCIPFHSGIR